ncbi:hypothetical protein [Spiroplasma citri]|uniref:hypothetical protein n=1 Tax=Spiroplasma citri TaxID=2133 RepID=UPI0011BBE4A1|nr:hypothetical protein [Spiroplasma citri]QED25158.1 hypothetical protein FRX96_07230 [Spiroplasma citri]
MEKEIKIDLKSKENFDYIKKHVLDFLNLIKNSTNLENFINSNIDTELLSYQYQLLRFFKINYSHIFTFSYFISKDLEIFIKNEYKNIKEKHYCTSETGFNFISDDITNIISEISDMFVLCFLEIKKYKIYEITILEILENKSNHILLVKLDEKKELLANLKEVESLWFNNKFNDVFLKIEGILKKLIIIISNQLNLEIKKISNKTNKVDYIELFSKIIKSQKDNIEGFQQFILTLKNCFEQIIIPIRNIFKLENTTKDIYNNFNETPNSIKSIYTRIYIDICKTLINVILLSFKNK